MAASNRLLHYAKKPYKRDNILQKRPIILRSLLIVATPYFCDSIDSWAGLTARALLWNMTVYVRVLFDILENMIQYITSHTTRDECRIAAFNRLPRPRGPHQKFSLNTENNHLRCKMALGHLVPSNEIHCGSERLKFCANIYILLSAILL